MANLTTLNREETEKMNPKSKLNDFSQSFQNAEKSVASWAEEEGTKIKQAYHDAEKGMSNVIETASSTIKKYPIGSIAVGFSLGCLAGYLARTAARS